MRSAVLYSHPSSLEHETGMHPERKERIVAIERELDARSLPLERAASPAADVSLLHRVHPPEYVEAISRFIAGGGGALDPDTVTSPGSWDAALHAAGGAVAVVDALLADSAPFAASVHRPPGHHAEAARAMGFCLFNNVAVAAAHALAAHGLSRVMIVDWDVHHGNGTNDIFWETDQVLFCSIHEWPLYPGTGRASDVGSGPGEGYTVNLPVPGGSGDAVYCSLVEHLIVPLLREYEPGLLLISAGFDAHADDPLATCMVTDAGYATMAASLRLAAAALDVPVGLVLEGGYDLGALSRSLYDVLDVFTAPAPPAAPSLDVDPIATEATARLSVSWPALA